MSKTSNLKPEISIIVPVYNVELYLDRCVKSILAQIYTQFELILVDDGSRDSSGQLCDEWKKKDSRINVIHKPNGGLSDARNVGVQNSKAELVTFIDSDDYVSEDFIQCLYNLLVDNDADISVCDFCMTQGEDVWDRGCDFVEVYDNVQACEKSFFSMSVAVACCKLFKKSFLLNMPFPVGRFHEDTATIGKILYQAKRIAVCTRKLYAYFQNPDSITHTPSLKQRSDQLWSVVEIATFYDSINENLLHNKSWQQVGELIYLQVRNGFTDAENFRNYLNLYLRNTSIFNILRIKIFCAIYLPFIISFWKKLKSLRSN